jgi:hypothetical protein
MHYDLDNVSASAFTRLSFSRKSRHVRLEKSGSNISQAQNLLGKYYVFPAVHPSECLDGTSKYSTFCLCT